MQSATPRQETAHVLRAMDKDFMRHANAGDAEALVAAFYAEDAELLPPNAPIMNGHGAIRDFWKGMMAAGLKISVLEAKKIDESGSLAYATGVYELTLSPPSAGTISDQGKYVVVYRQQSGGQWKAVADIFNSGRPAA